jgi:hypothetical protein
MEIRRVWLGAALSMAIAAAQTQIDLRTQSKDVDFSGAVSTRPVKLGTALPGVCAPGELFFKSNAPAGQNLYGCSSTNTWTLQSSGTGGGGGGTPPNIQPGSVGGINITSTVDTTFLDLDAAFVLTAIGDNAPTGNMTPGGGQWDLTGVSEFKPRNGTSDPATCAPGELFVNTSTTPVLKLCTAANVWTAAGGSGGGGTLPTTTKGDLIAHDATTNVRVPVGADGQVLGADSSQAAGVRYLPVTRVLRTARSATTCTSGSGSVFSYTIPASLLTTGDVVRVHGLWEHTGGSSSPRVQYLVGGTPMGTNFTLSGTFGQFEYLVFVTGATSQAFSLQYWRDNTALASAADSTSLTANVASPVTLDFQQDSCSGGDTVRLSLVAIEVIKNANI